MYEILIDTTDRYKKSVRLVKDNNDVDVKEGDSDIVVAIRDILKKNDLKLSDITSIKANPGPGSFTGLKIGTTVANVFNYFTGKTSLESLQKPKYGGKPNIHKTKWID